MENPRIRPLEVVPVEQEGQQMFLLRDPEGIAERSLMVSRDVLFILSLMDGSKSLDNLRDEYTKAFGQPLLEEQVASVIDAMDRGFLLNNDRYKDHLTEIMMSYASLACRPSFLAGKSFPANGDHLREALTDLLPGPDGIEMQGSINGILAPHIDYMRGKKVYAEVYPYLRHAKPDLIVIFGTCHNFTPNLWNISLKDFETPLGTMKNSRDLASLIRENQVLADYIFEWPHRTEHSIELQLPIIQFLTDNRDIEILPILTGSMHQFIAGERELSDGELSNLTESLKGVLERYGKSYLVIAAADLAHIGHQFGDRFDMEEGILSQSRRSDTLIVDKILKADARGFFNAVKDEGDSRRICGLSPIYFQLSLLGAVKSLPAGYDQWSDGASSVSFAGAVFYD